MNKNGFGYKEFYKPKVDKVNIELEKVRKELDNYNYSDNTFSYGDKQYSITNEENKKIQGFEDNIKKNKNEKNEK